jgi:uncharacterized protein
MSRAPGYPGLLAGLLLLALSAAVRAQAPSPRIAIIIDDLGNQQAAGERVIALPGPVTCAILPGSPWSRALAERAHAGNKEILVHLPMQAANYRGRTEPGMLTLDMNRAEIVAAVDHALAAVPHAVGLNNHRGSLLTRHPEYMQWLMAELRGHPPLFFIDSYTTHHSIALRIAAENGVRAVKRDVFLDAERSPDSVRAEFERLKTLARRNGSAVAIGHPHDETLALLEAELPGLDDAGYELVPVSALLSNPDAAGYSNYQVQGTR